MLPPQHHHDGPTLDPLRNVFGGSIKQVPAKRPGKNHVLVLGHQRHELPLLLLRIGRGGGGRLRRGAVFDGGGRRFSLGLLLRSLTLRPLELGCAITAACDGRERDAPMTLAQRKCSRTYTPAWYPTPIKNLPT